MQKYDIVIAGGAMAGATLALALDNLSKGALSVAVVEPYQVTKESHPGFDSRSIALSYGTRLLLEKFSLWHHIKPLATPIRHIHVSDRGHMGMTDIFSDEESVSALGYVVELEEVGTLYADLISRSENIHFYCPDSVSSVSRSSEECQIELTNGESLSCKLLVAADGAESVCGSLLGHTNVETDFNQVAVIANIKVAEEHKGRAFERFTPTGPLALLPMSENRMSVVWCLDPEQASEVCSLTEEAFITKLQKDFGWRLGKITQCGSVASYPLILKRKEQIISHRFAMVGNASQLLHPIAGQGFNLGIRDIAELTKQLTDKPAGQQDPGDFSLLNRYRVSREKDRSQTIELIAGMVYIFSNDWFPAQVGRNLALMLMDNIPILKHPLLKRTMGLVEK